MKTRGRNVPEIQWSWSDSDAWLRLDRSLYPGPVWWDREGMCGGVSWAIGSRGDYCWQGLQTSSQWYKLPFPHNQLLFESVPMGTESWLRNIWSMVMCTLQGVRFYVENIQCLGTIVDVKWKQYDITIKSYNLWGKCIIHISNVSTYYFSPKTQVST